MQILQISSEHCRVEREGHILVVTLNRPEQKNALSSGMLLSMYRAWRLLDEDKTLYCAILTGSGDTFCSGMDLKQKSNTTTDGSEIQEMMKSVPDLHWQAMLKTNRPKKPVILAVEGYAIAGGSEIALGTDLRVCAEDAKFGIPETRLGLFPLGGSTARLPSQIPYIIAAEILILGRKINANEALQWNIVNWVVPKGEAFTKAMSIAEEICQCAPLSIQAMMKMLRRQSEIQDEGSMLKEEETLGWSIMVTSDAKEGMKAFREKRQPIFSGA